MVISPIKETLSSSSTIGCSSVEDAPHQNAVPPTAEEPDFDPPDDDEFILAEPKKKISDEILYQMFNTGVSFRTLSEILKLAFKVVEAENHFHLSPAHLFQRYKNIMEVKENDHKAAIGNEKSFGTICFDHQSMQTLNVKRAQKEDRLAIVWHSNSKDNLLAVEKMNDKSGNSQAAAIQRVCENFQISANQIVALSCDNASTNIGHFNGTCTILEAELEKELLRTNCRRHIYEIVIKDVYHHLFNSSAPNNLFFPILKEKWMLLRERNFPYLEFDEETFTENFDEELWQSFQEFKSNALHELKLQSKSKCIRDDYKESNNVCLKFFGVRQPKTKRNQVEFRALIEPSNARFMAALIQGLQCYLFRDSLDWESPERQKVRKNLDRFAAFVALVYIRFWNRCSILFDSTYNDLYFLQELQKFAQFDSGTARVAIAALNRHLYYMSEELAVLSLFSEKISILEKNRISDDLFAIMNEPIPDRQIDGNELSNCIKYLAGNENTDWRTIQVHDLIGKRSLFLFNALNLSVGFLEIDAALWARDDEYIEAKKKISNTLICTNENSERMISLCKVKNKNQRCRSENSFRRSLFASSSKYND